MWCSLYIECVDHTGTLEWNTVNDTLVKLHQTVIGPPTGAPADDMIFVVNTDNSLAVLVQPGRESPMPPFLVLWCAFFAVTRMSLGTGRGAACMGMSRKVGGCTRQFRPTSSCGG